MTPEDARAAIKSAGIKFYKVAADCAIHPTILGAYLNNRKDLTAEQSTKLESYINRLRAIAPQNPPPADETNIF